MNRPTIQYPSVPIYLCDTQTPLPSIPLGVSDLELRIPPVYIRDMTVTSEPMSLSSPLPEVRRKESASYPLTAAGRLWRTLALCQSIAVVILFLVIYTVF